MELGKVQGGGYTPPAAGKENAPRSKADTSAVSAAARSAVDWVDLSRSQAEESPQSTPYGPDWLKEQIESANQQAKATAKQGEVSRKCMRIAGHLMSGDRVDPKDLQYLMEHDMRTYQLVMSMRQEKANPKEHKRISGEKEEQSSTTPALGGSVPLPELGALSTEGTAPVTTDGGEP